MIQLDLLHWASTHGLIQNEPLKGLSYKEAYKQLPDYVLTTSILSNE